VTRKTPVHYTELRGLKIDNDRPSQFKVALIDCGVKYNIVRMLVEAGCDVTVFPASTKSEDLISGRFDGIVVSNGPGDPEVVTYTIDCIKDLIKGRLAIMGICLGHQLLAHAFGAKTYKLMFGHHGANHPVKNVDTAGVEITSQNHGFAVDEASAIKAGFQVTHVNLNDNTIEGIAHRSYPAFAVQYHPEASPGPHDSRYLFEKFTKMMTEVRAGKPLSLRENSI
jgi:carbamoyl-phosphate synthase small subunit